MQYLKKLSIVGLIAVFVMAINNNGLAQRNRGGGNNSRGGNYGDASRGSISSRGGANFNRGGNVGRVFSSPNRGGGLIANNYHPRVSAGLFARPNYYNRYGSRSYYGGGYGYRTPFPFIHFGPAFGFRINILPFGYYPFYFGGNPYYYYNGIYYQPYYGGGYQVVAPPLGAAVLRLPVGAKVSFIDGQKYYEIGGTFYQEEVTVNNQLQYRVVGINGVLNTPISDADVNQYNDGTSMQQPNDYNNQNNYLDNNSAITAPQTQQIPPQQQMPQTQLNDNLPQVGERFDVLPPGTKQVIINKQKYFTTASGVYYQEVFEGNTIRYEVTGISQQ